MATELWLPSLYSFAWPAAPWHSEEHRNKLQPRRHASRSPSLWPDHHREIPSASSEEFLESLNYTQKVNKMAPIQRANKGAPIQEKQKITDGITEKSG